MTTETSTAAGLTPIAPSASLANEIAEMIDVTEVFSDLPWAGIQILATYFQPYRVGTGGAVFREGDTGNFACFILDGQVDVHREDINHEVKTIISLGPGKFLGETAVIEDDARSASAIASKPTILIILTKENFLRLIHEKPALAISLLIKWAHGLSQRLRRASGMLIEHLHG